jgi:hypothetical protein
VRFKTKSWKVFHLEVRLKNKNKKQRFQIARGGAFLETSDFKG